MAETYMQMFREKFYPDIFTEAAEKTIRGFVEKQEQIVEVWKREIKKYLNELAVMQCDRRAGAVSEIDISFLYTSLTEGRTEFRVDSYGKGGRVSDESLVTSYLPAEWLSREFAGMEENMKRCAAEEGLRDCLRPAAFDVFKLTAARTLLYYFVGRFKYLIKDMIDQRDLARIQKEDVFVIRMGEYMDWQNVLYAIVPMVDIFDCPKGTRMMFRHFPAIVYKNKLFAGQDFTHAEFTDCTFTDVTIEACTMNDCTFDGCVFEGGLIKGTQMAGCLFKGCIFRQVELKEVLFDGMHVQGHEQEYFEPAQFWDCTFTMVCFHACRLSGTVVVNCEAQETKILGGEVGRAELAGIDGVLCERSGVKEPEGGR